ncbi:MAG: DNA repair ATPase [Polyangiaceae bacterium]
MAEGEAKTEGEAQPAAEDAAAALEGGSYDVIRKRLLERGTELRKKAEWLNQRRVETFGGSELALLGTERIRTENNCVSRDIRQVGGKLLFTFNVFLGLKTETVVGDVFSVHDFVEKGAGKEIAFDFPTVPIDEKHYLSDPSFVKEFGDLYRYNRDAKFLQLLVTDTRILAVFQIGATARERKIFRWGIDKGGRIQFIDTRGEDDYALPKQHDFAWTACTREDQVAGDHPHYSILNEVFVETVGGDLTVKVENNTKDGRGIYREDVEDKNQSLDDADVQYCKVGALIVMRIKPYRENQYRHLVFNTRTQTIARIDSIQQSCLQLPEDQGIIFPGGFYLRTGEYKVFDGNMEGMVFRRAMKSPNGEDVLYVYERLDDGMYLLLPYNLIRKEVANPLLCHGYSVFDNGRLIILRTPSDEPSKVHTLQVWNTPFCTQEHAAAAPTDGSYLAKIGNAELVRGISEALTIERIAANEKPTRQSYEDVISSSQRIVDAHHWIGHAEAGNLGAAVLELRKTAELIIDEFEKVAAIRKRAADSLAAAEVAQDQLFLALRPDDMRSVEEFMGSLADLRKQRGSLITLKEMRYMDLARVEVLEKAVVEQFERVSKHCVEFLLKPAALEPLVKKLADVVGKATAVNKAAELKPIAADTDRVGEGLTVLSDVINTLNIEDPTQRTKILEGTSEAFSQLNRARATIAARKKELSSAEGKSEFSAQFRLFGQSVVSSLALCTTPEKCDEHLSRLLLSLEELEAKFSEFDEFLGDLTAKREEVTDAIAARRQQLLDERQRRAQSIVGAADRILQGVARKAKTFKSPDELNTYFASDTMILKLRDLAKQLFDLGDTVKGDEVESRLKSARQDALRALRDKTELFEGGDNVIKLGKHRFNVSTQQVELTLVPRRDDATNLDVQYIHLTGTDFFERIEDRALEDGRPFWDQELVSEDKSVYRSEFLASAVLGAAERNEEGLSLESLQQSALKSGGLLEAIRAFAVNRHDEGYERGVHDVDAAAILEKVLGMRATAGLLRYPADARAIASLAWATFGEADRLIVQRSARSFFKIAERLGSSAAQASLADELVPRLEAVAKEHRVTIEPALYGVAARYMVEELGRDRPRFVVSQSATTLQSSLQQELDRANLRRDFDEDLRTLEKHPAERLGLVRAWFSALVSKYPDLAPHGHALLEASVVVATDRKVEREPSSAAVEVSVTGLLGQHSRIVNQAMHLRLDDFVARIARFVAERVPGFRAFRKTKQDVLDRERKRLRLAEFTPRVLSSFVRNRLIDEVYLHLVGDNLAKQMGAAGDSKRTDLMGLLLLVSPPGYGKTTLMEYVANRLGLIFMKVNGPALGHDVRSLDPEEAPNATARQEVDKINLALEMGNNVMLYLDDIQHTHPELLQKFISLCDAQRKIEGVWKKKTRTYDLRGKKFCICMAGNPYTESGEKFRIPDMLANRADTYNLGDILDGREELFALSYIENALTSNKVLAPLSGRDPGDTHKLIKMSRGEPIPATELAYPYSAAEVSEILEVLKRLFKVQEVLLKVNLEYIASASQDDNFRTEPPFKLQGSYRNMNKISEKIVAAHTDAEIEAVIDDHYAGESQTLTTGAENNLLKLASMRGRMTPEKEARWEEIKKSYVRVKMMGGKNDDPVARVTGALGTLGSQLDGIGKTLDRAVAGAHGPALTVARELDKIQKELGALAGRPLNINVERDPAMLEILAQQLGAAERQLAPIVHALTESLGQMAASTKSEAQKQAESLAAAQAQLAGAQAAQAITLREMQQAAADAKHAVTEARSAANVQAQQMQQASEFARQVIAQQQQATAQLAQTAQTQAAAVRAHQQILAQEQQLLVEEKSLLAQEQQLLQQGVALHQQEVAELGQIQQTAQQAARAAASMGHAAQAVGQAAQSAAQAAQVVGQSAKRVSELPPPPAGAPVPAASIAPVPPGLVQRPGMSAAESEAVARAQLAQAKALAAGASPEMSAAVFRVEHRLGELIQIVKNLKREFAGSQHPRFDAPIDLESASNFYRWKKGADVVREGGVFIASYRAAPSLGSTVSVHVSLPGGLEFETLAVVEWSRPGGDKGPPWTQPGFGARFTDLSPDAHALVQQFVKAREPMLFEQR